MEHREILLQIWREACQPGDMATAVAGIAPLLSAHLPLDALHVFRVEPQHQLLARVAGFGLEPSAPDERPAERRERELEKLAAWVRRGAIAVPNVRGQWASSLLPLGLEPQGRDGRVVPLKHDDDVLGLAAFFAPPGRRFSSRHESLIEAMREPLAVALAGDRRLHELAALREAAEADRRSLLRRLGRTDITDTIVGAEHGLRQVIQRVQLVSQSDAPVLLLGETGTGKEVIARAVHDRSDRHDFPFIRVNCGAIPRELIDSQLFGHEKGAYTGASEQRSGWFERADGGTLFLDEIGELPLDAQVRFLRVLQDGHVERVGGSEPVRVDVRIIAATHRDLAGMVQEGRFREDLWYRIAVFPILLPPLRDRLEDLPELAAHFAHRAANRFGLTPVEPSPADISLLRKYPWPGNIRELGAVIDRAAILGEGHMLEIEAALGFASPPRSVGSTRGDMGNSIGFATLDQAMKDHIEAALRATGGRVEGREGAAELLDINPHTLRARMRKLSIDWSAFRRGPTDT